MSLSVERLKKVLEAVSYPTQLDAGAFCIGATVADISDAASAIRKLIAIEEDELKSHKKYNESPVSVANNDLAEQSNQSCQYGRCPICGRPGIERERRLNGNDTCAGGHKYPSRVAILK